MLWSVPEAIRRQDMASGRTKRIETPFRFVQIGSNDALRLEGTGSGELGISKSDLHMDSRREGPERLELTINNAWIVAKEICVADKTQSCCLEVARNRKVSGRGWGRD